MVYLELIEDTNDRVVYDFMPETRQAARGRIAVDKATREKTLITESPDAESSAYKAHAARRIVEMLDSGNLKKETYAAWC